MPLTSGTGPARFALPTLAALLMSCLCLLGVGDGQTARKAAGGAQPAAERGEDPLVDLNQDFRDAYARSRRALLDRAGPVILVEGDSLVLLHHGNRREAKVIPDVYHTLKAVSHVPLAVYVILVPFQDAPLDGECLAGLRDYRKRVVQAEAALQGHGLSEEALQRQRRILATSVRSLDAALAKKRVTALELENFTRGLGRDLLANAADAARAELDALDKQVRAWRATLPAEAWKQLHVVVMGSALPRRGNLATQYFARLLGEKGEGRRIVYAESTFEEARALNLLGTNLLDTRIGSAFFDDAERMHRDLLSDAARMRLEKMTVGP
jgi:hypothetical protein